MTLGAVLPICIRGSYDNDDLGRLDILFNSLTAFATPSLFEHFLVVTPADEVSQVSDYCKRWAHLNLDFISEEELVPEFVNHRQVRGWRKQQIIKLAAARRLKQDFFLTFDADVICLKPIGVDNLFVDGKAILQYEARALHPKWWRSSAKILRMDPQVGNTEIGMSVTPVILSRAICELVAKELTPKRGTWVDTLCRLHNPKSPSNWTLSRLLKSKWTEYSLYYLCAMKHNILDDYHVSAGSDEVPQVLLTHESHPFENWQPQDSFAIENPGLFCVVGSKSGLPPSTVWEKVKDFIPHQPQQ